MNHLGRPYRNQRAGILHLVVLYLSISTVAAQQTDIGEFPLSTFRSVTTMDTATIIATIDRARNVAYRQPDSSLYLLGTALRASRVLRYNDGIARTLMQMAQCYRYKGDYDQSIALLQQAQIYCMLADPQTTLSSSLYFSLATIKTLEGKFEEAITGYFKSLKDLEEKKIDNPELLCKIYNSLGVTWMRQKQKDRAHYYFEKAMAVAKQNDLVEIQAYIYGSMGGLYVQTDTALSRIYSQKAYAMAKAHENALVLQCSAVNLGSSYQLDDPEKALVYYFEALEYGDTDPYYSKVGPYIGIGQTYNRLKDYMNARKYLQLAVMAAEKTGMKDLLSVAYYGLAQADAGLGDYQSALNWQQRFGSLHDSLTNVQQVANSHRMEVKYRTAEKDKRIAADALSLTRQQSKIREQQIWIGAGATSILLLISLLLVLHRNTRHRRRLQQQQINNMRQQQEITALKAMIQGEEKERGRLARELHDGIVSQLAAAKLNFSDVRQRYAVLQGATDFEAAIHQLDDAALDLRNTAHNLMPEILLQQGFVPSLALYCERMSKHAGSHIYFHLTGDLPMLDAQAALSIYRIVQELLQNSIKHADATQVVVQINADPSLFLLTVEDNGRGMTQELLGADNLLKTVRTRVQVLNGSMDVRSETGKGTTIAIDLDMETLKQKATNNVADLASRYCIENL